VAPADGAGDGSTLRIAHLRAVFLTVFSCRSMARKENRRKNVRFLYAQSGEKALGKEGFPDVFTGWKLRKRTVRVCPDPFFLPVFVI
jgi:hypothetical protein